jgi:F0F1-type ATP synthase gamma subunit
MQSGEVAWWLDSSTLTNQSINQSMNEHHCTENAGEMLNTLTLSYNRQRQAGITTELSEIIAGTEAIQETE